MLERFTDGSRRVLVLAMDEATLFGHSYIGTEHILLGLIREEDGFAAQALAQCGISLEAARDQVRENVKTSTRLHDEAPQFTPRAVKSLENANREARHLDRDSVGTKFVLIGLIREAEMDRILRRSVDNEGAAKVLENLGVDLGSLLTKVLALMVGSAEGERND
jgi:ATP-dependent Clp protease ATP-binding subunit ClpC